MHIPCMWGLDIPCWLLMSVIIHLVEKDRRPISDRIVLVIQRSANVDGLQVWTNSIHKVFQAVPRTKFVLG